MRSAVRQFVKAPWFTAAVVGTLALGIGANTALFSVVNGVLLKSLPFDHAARLVWIWSTRTDRDKAFYSIPDFLDTQSSVRTLDRMCAFASWSVGLAGSGDTERLLGVRISADAFETMGVHPLAGRLLEPSDERKESSEIVVLSHALWVRRFGADRSLIGRSLTLNGESYKVAGILPLHFHLPGTEAELFVPFKFDADPMRYDRGANFLRSFGRLARGATVSQAAAELAITESRLRKAHPLTNTKHTDPRVLSFQDEMTGDYRTGLWTLLGAVAFVLLIACSNLANLLLVRATTRGREIAIRKALGASRMAVVWQLLSETLLLAFAGGALGILVAQWVLKLILFLSPAGLPRVNEITLDIRVLMFTLLTTAVCGILFGLAPALHAASSGIGGHLRTRLDPVGFGRSARCLLPVAEIALAFVLLTGAGLLLKSFVRLNAVNPGFAANNLMLVRISLPSSYSTAASIARFYNDLAQRLRTLPGVESVALGTALPLSGVSIRTDFIVIGRRPLTRLDVPAAQNRWISAGYLRTMGIPILAGREFSEDDVEREAGVVVIDQALASQHWPSRSPLGQFIHAFGRDLEVIGVAGNVKHNDIDDSPTPTFYAPFSIVPQGALRLFSGNVSVVLRTSFDPRELEARRESVSVSPSPSMRLLAGSTSIPPASGDLRVLDAALQRELRVLDPRVSASSIQNMDEFLESAIAPRRFNLQLVGVFAIAALILAASGLYAVLSYGVSLRTSEIGLRMALGARPSSVVRLIAGEAVQLVATGIVLGLGAALVMIRLVSSLLYDTPATDPTTFIGVVAVFFVTATVAAWIPARRASRIDPLSALRAE